MPEVSTQSGVKRFSYTKKGKKKAEEYAKKTGGKIRPKAGKTKKRK